MNARRQFVMAGAAAGVLLPGVGASAATVQAVTGPLRGTSAQRRVGGMPAQSLFEALRGKPLGLAGGGSLTVDRVHARSSHQPIEQFTVVLRGSPTQRLGEGRYELYHPLAGELTLHLTPSGRDGRDRLYRADLSLLV